jgi:NMD protein affecting ribosome stability and mRNA decay
MFAQGRIDPYRRQEKLPDSTVCPDCGAVFLQGRWTWNDADGFANQHLCPACKRTQDNVPAGVIELSGGFFHNHRQEIENLIRNEEAKEKERHPLERLMKTKEKENGLRVETTGLHLARRIGDALNRAYEGDLDLQYLDGQYKVRVSWNREE